MITQVLPQNPVVITTGPLRGLGDHLIYSSLPERFAALGLDVYLDADIQVSNPEIFECVWKRNPFIKGFSDIKPNAGYTRQGLYYILANRISGYRSIEVMERAHALPPPYNMAPKIYYEPKPYPIDLSNTVLLDFSAVSSRILERGLNEAINTARGRYGDSPFLQVLHRKHIVLHVPPIGAQSVQVDSIYEYLDMLHACKAWIGSEAGGQSLASAVRGERDAYDETARPRVDCTIVPPTFNSRGYTYRNVNYYVTGSTVEAGEHPHAKDYWQPHEVSVTNYEISCMKRDELIEAQ